jgi:hypothetical protein
VTQRPLPHPIFKGDRPLLIVGLAVDGAVRDDAIHDYATGIGKTAAVNIGTFHGATPLDTDGVTALPTIVRPFGGPLRVAALTTGVTVHETSAGGRLAIFREPRCWPNEVFTHLILTDDDGGKGGLIDRLTVGMRRHGDAGAYPILAEIDAIVRATLVRDHIR